MGAENSGQVPEPQSTPRQAPEPPQSREAAAAPATPVAVEPPVSPVPPAPSAAEEAGEGTDATGTVDALTGAGERLELAKAYVELGDVETARDLLQEVVDAGSAPESGEAARLLRELAQA